MAGKTHVNFWIDSAIRARLVELAMQDGRTLSGLLRHILSRHVDERKQS